MTQNFPTTNPIAARVDDDGDVDVDVDVDDDHDHTVVIPRKAPGDLAIVLPDGCRLWISLPPLAPLLSPELGGAAYDEATIQSILRDALDVTKPLPLAQTPAGDARKSRKPALNTLLKQAARAGKSVKGAAIYPDRTVLQFGEPTTNESDNPWDVAAAALRQKKELPQ